MIIVYVLYEYIFICLYRQQSIHKSHAYNTRRRQNKIICCGGVWTRKNKYILGVGSLRKINNTITNKIRTKKFLRRNLVFKYQKLVFKYQNKKEQMLDFLVFKVRFNI